MAPSSGIALLILVMILKKKKKTCWVDHLDVLAYVHCLQTKTINNDTSFNVISLS